MSVSAELIADWDTLAASLGITPKYDQNGQVVPIGQREGLRMAVYVVWVGRAIGLFNNWGLASAMTTAFPGASQKRYGSLEEARRGWEQGPVAMQGPWHPPRPRPAVPTPGFQPPARPPSPPPPESNLSVSPAVATAAPVVVHMPHPLDVDSDDDVYWDSDPAPPPPASPGPPSPTSPMSPTLSSVSSITTSSIPSLTTGTLSDGTINTPVPRMAELRVTSPSPTPRITNLPTSLPRSEYHAVERVVHGSSKGLEKRRVGASGTSGTSGPSGTSGTSGQRAYVPPPSQVAVEAPKEVFVVVRGDQPGVYLDRNTALLVAGTSPAMKIVVFNSRSQAAWYFVKQYMAHKVGVPPIVGDKASDPSSSEAEDREVSSLV
ncbi:hypothetical protein C8Q76DRAFT_792431 [Earliella scabrosa]|nr:hypothetical protein C8Q76DRAFT_792431 [Earliella scabrosa]